MNTVIFAMTKINNVYSGHGVVLEISKRAKNIWDNRKQIKPEMPEGFGVLIGSCKKSENSCQIVSVTTPYDKDSSSRTLFYLQDPSHQRTVDKAFAESEGCLAYLGTWHTHPEPDPNPSMIDIQDWLSCINRNPDRQLFFVIVGTKQTRVFVKNEDEFIILEDSGL